MSTNAATVTPPLPTIDDRDYLFSVVTHRDLRPLTSSSSNEVHDNERLAELGSRILDQVITYHLFAKQPMMRVEEIRTWRDHWTSPNMLNSWLDRYNLKRRLLAPPDRRDAILNDLQEMARYLHSYVGALYATKGQGVIETWISGLIDTGRPPPRNPGFAAASQFSSEIRPSTIPVFLFNETATRRGFYTNFVATQQGPPHQPTWTVRCFVNNLERGIGTGVNQKAAREASVQQAWAAMGW